MLWLDHKYVNLLSGRLDRFRRKSDTLYNFRCPLCGDGHDGRKTRGYVYVRGDSLVFHCHNCGATRSLRNLLRELDSVLHAEYLKELLLEDRARRTHSPEDFRSSKPSFQERPAPATKSAPAGVFKRVTSLPDGHPACLYLSGRAIPSEHVARLLYSDSFMRAINRIVPGKFAEDVVERADEPRIVIPYHDRDGELVGVQGRSIGGDSRLRYITVPFVEDAPRIYGLDLVDVELDVLVLEGAFDSMFLPNAIAMSGSNMTADLAHVPAPRERFVVVYDCEPRNREIVSKMEGVINRGFRVVVWPDSTPAKDVNSMVLSGLTAEEVGVIVRDHTYSGPRAMIELSRWRRV